jgi:DNA ligase D-like protein (predicted ligase)
VSSKDPGQFLPTSVQKSHFMLSRPVRAVLDTALRKYRAGRNEPVLIGGINLLKPALRLMTDYRLVIQEVEGPKVITSYTRWIESKDAEGNVIKEAPLPVWANFQQRALGVELAEVNAKTDLKIKLRRQNVQSIGELSHSTSRSRLSLSGRDNAIEDRSPANTKVPAPKKTTSRKIGPAKLSRQGIGVSRLPARLPSAPLPEFVEPMKAQLFDSIRPGDWIYEIKFDGYRALALRGGHETRILSRNQKDLGKKFPDITDSIAGLDVQDAIIDGEIVALDDKGRSSFQLLQGFDMGLVRPPIVFYAFDLLRLDGEDLRGLPIEERKAKLAALLKPPRQAIRYSASFSENIDELLNKVRELGLEGLIGKHAGSKYDSKRSGAWIKIKLYQQGSFVIGGYTQPAGERKHMGALLVGVYENGKLKFTGRVGTGFSEKLLRALSVELNKIAVKACPFFNLPATGRGLDPGLTIAEMKRCVWVKPLMVCEVKFTEWTRDDRLRQPVFLGLREDKNASEVIREQVF